MDHRQTSSLSSSQRQTRREEEKPTIDNSLQRMRRMSSKNSLITEGLNSYGVPLKPGVKSSAVIVVRENRTRDKHDLHQLNERFASYIERVRFLEGLNKKFQLDIDQAREQWASQKNKIKEMYEIELDEARYTIDDTDQDRAAADLRAKRAEEEVSKLKDKYVTLLVGKGSDQDKIEQLQKQISDNEADINLFRRRLADLQDEQQRYRSKAQNILSDIQDITKELDHEITTRIQMEIQKEKLEEEINFLKELHSQKIEQIKQTSLISTDINSGNFFQRELSRAIEKIRTEYEERDDQQRDELEAWYQWKLARAIQEVQSLQIVERSDDIRRQNEFENLQILISDSRQDISAIRQRNENIENRICELEQLIHMERDDHVRASDEHQRQIRDIQARLDNLDQNYHELTATKSSLNSEITGYRKLLEGGEKREHLLPMFTHVQERPLSSFATDKSTSHSYPRSYQRTSTSQTAGDDYSPVIPYAPSQSVQSTQIEPTIFEQVYGCYRRPTTVSFNTSRKPVGHRSPPSKWRANNVNTRKSKTTTIFETDKTPKQQQKPKAVTPPSSDYTDAYLLAFAPKPIAMKRTYRLANSVFTDVAPLPLVPKRTHLFTDNAVKTSQTRFNNTNNVLSSNSFDNTLSHFPSSTSTYQSSFTPIMSTNYHSFSSTQPSSIETQTLNSDYLSSSGNTQSPFFIHPTTYRSESPFENASQSMSSTTIISSLPSPTQPSVPFHSEPLSLPPKDFNKNNARMKEILPSVNTEKQTERPEILLFEHDEDIHLSPIEKLSPIVTASLASPITPIESKNEPEHSPMEELSIASSKPIEILENTITKYDSLINQISDMLASVSPVSSTVSNISPTKTVLGDELSGDSSSILQHQQIETSPAQQSSTPIRNPYIQRVKTKHMIRRDSYDKIITAIIDLDEEMTPPPDIQISSFTEQIREEAKTTSVDERHTISSINEKDEEMAILLADENPLSLGIEKERDKHQHISPTPSDLLANGTSSFNKASLDNHDFIHSQINLPTDEIMVRKTSVPHNELIWSENDENRVNYWETVVDDEDDESLSYQSLIEESYSLLPPIAISEASTPVVKQHLNTSVEPSSSRDQRSASEDATKSQISSSSYLEDQTSSDRQEDRKEIIEQQIIPSGTTSLQIDASDVTKSPMTWIKRKIKYSSSLQASSSFSDSVERQTTSSDADESQVSHEEQLISSRNSSDAPLVPAMNSPNKDAFPTDERWTAMSNVISQESNVGKVEETELNEVELIAPSVDDVEHGGTKTSDNEDIGRSLPSISVTPIDALTDSISTRFTSSDVYHGCLGDRKQSIESLPDIDTENTKRSLLISLRQTISTPMVPLIETIPSVVSSMQMLTAMEAGKSNSKMMGDDQNETRLTTAVSMSSTDAVDEREARSAKDKEVTRTLVDADKASKNRPADEDEHLSTAATEESTSSEDLKKLTTSLSNRDIVSLNEELADRSSNETESTRLSSFESMQKEIPAAMANPIKAIAAKQDEEQIVSNSRTIIVEQIEKHQNIAFEPLSSEIPTRLSAENKVTESIVLSENITNTRTVKASDIESVVSELVETAPVDQKIEDRTSIASTGSTANTQDNEEMLTTADVLYRQSDAIDRNNVFQVESASVQIMNQTISDQQTSEMTTSMDDTTPILAIVTGKIESIVPSSSIAGRQSPIKQIFESTVDQANNEQITTIETLSSPRENEQIFTAQKLESYPGEVMMSSLTLSSKDSDEKNRDYRTSHSIDMTTIKRIETSPVPISSMSSPSSTVLKTNEFTSDINQDHRNTHHTISDITNDTNDLVSSGGKQITDIAPTKCITSQNDDDIQVSSSMKTEMENILSDPSMELPTSSVANTDPDSFELIHALRGHSIALPTSPVQRFNPQEKSSSSTTSSHITSSDRYVSYAIHQMHDSSQDRLPALPLAADMPNYKTNEGNVLLDPMIATEQPIMKEDDLTEFDATENLTSYSDDILYRRLYRSDGDRRQDLDTTSTDDDVDEEFEEHDLTNIHRITDKLTPTSSSLSTNEGHYHRYDLVMTPSSDDSSSSLSKQQPDDVYLIPGYPGLWRASADHDDTNLPIDYDADDERKEAIKINTATSLSDSMRRPLSFQQYQDQTANLPHSEILNNEVLLRPNSLDISNRPLNEFPFDISESDTYHTCPSSLSKHQKQSDFSEIKSSEDQHQSSPEESIFLICERERGVSLPVTMNIDCDDITFRLSTSTPIDAELCSTIQPNLPSPSTLKADSSTRTSSLILSNQENSQQKPSPCLENVNTATTTKDSAEPSQFRVTFQKSVKGPISVSECHPQGHYIIIDNTSRAKTIDLTNWIIQQENDREEKIIFTFPEHCLLKPNHSLKILTKTSESEQRNDDDLVATSVPTWSTGPFLVTTLINPEGKDRATLTKKTIYS